MVSAGMPLAQALGVVQAALSAAGCPDADYDAAELLLLTTGVQARFADATRVLTEAEAENLAAVSARRAAREPLQYIWGRWPFLNFELAVGQGVLCPRADTEVVVEHAARYLNGIAAPKVLELCGGSGCIGLGLKMFCPAADITVLEKSADALPYLRENAAHTLDEIAKTQPVLTTPYIHVVEGDLFAYHATLPDAAFDLLISNPPYLTAGEMKALQPEVAREPAMALAAGADGLDFYRAIATDYKRVVRPGGVLVLEIGCNQAAEVTALLTNAGWQDVSTHKDYGNHDRCIIARHP